MNEYQLGIVKKSSCPYRMVIVSSYDGHHTEEEEEEEKWKSIKRFQLKLSDFPSL